MKKVNKNRLNSIARLPDKALGIFKRNGFVFDGKQGPWQKLAFTLYSEMVGASTKANLVLAEDEKKQEED